MKKLEDYEKDDWELIETLWNVNMKTYVSISEKFMELIETLWNVNKNMRHTRQESTPN